MMLPTPLYPTKELGSECDYVECPGCRQKDGSYTHVEQVYTSLGSDKHEAKVYKGTLAHGKTGARRSALVIEFSCENCGVPFRWVIQQHKGQNTFWCEQGAV